jgi:hypothetical protein
VVVVVLTISELVVVLVVIVHLFQESQVVAVHPLNQDLFLQAI